MNHSSAQPDKRASIRDVARYAGVSHTMVSLILNGKHPGAPDTRAKVLDAVEKLNYQPDAHFRKAVAERKRPKKGTRTGILAFIMPRWIKEAAEHDDGYYSRTLTGVMRAAEAVGYEILLSPQDLQSSGVPACVMDDRVDGVLLDDSFPSEWVKLVAARIPCAYINRFYPGIDAVFITAHWPQAIWTMVEYAWQQGHRNFAFLGADTGDRHLVGVHRRFYEALEAQGGALMHPELSRKRPRGTDQSLMVAGFIDEWEKCDPRPTIVLTDDSKACELSRQMASRGYSIPDDLSIIGRLGHPNAAMNTPPITTYEYPVREIAERAVRMLVETIERGAQEPSHLMIEGRLIERASVKKLN